MPRLSPTMMEFSDFEGLNLIVLPLEKRVFTWTSGTDLPPMSKIDKVLFSSDWEEHFSNVI